MTSEDQARLFAELRRIGEETKGFNYIPGRFLQDLASSSPDELITRYVIASRPTAGFERLWEEGRLDLAVENVAWRNRQLFPPHIGEVAKARLAASGFDVDTQTMRPRRS